MGFYSHQEWQKHITCPQLGGPDKPHLNSSKNHFLFCTTSADVLNQMCRLLKETSAGCMASDGHSGYKPALNYNHVISPSN